MEVTNDKLNLETEIEEVVNKDAEVTIVPSKDLMSAEAYITPPEGEGKPANKDMINKALRESKIVFGINKEVVEHLSKPVYNERVIIANGVDVEHGENGTVEELFARERVRSFALREDGTADYKEHNFILDVEKGTAICNITLPTKGTDGQNIHGLPLKAVAGKPAENLAGEGTRISHDGLKIEAARNGNLEFKKDKFCVSNLVRVKKVDLDTGNIKFSGNVHVEEEVSDGFIIKSGGDVQLDGYVGACTVIAKGNITIQKGVNGTGRAIIEAGKSIQAGYVENAKLTANEKISAKSIMNSDVSCEGEIDITQGKGLVCGGKITCYGNVKANIVGNEQSTPTKFVLGVTSNMLKEKAKLEEDIKTLSNNVDEMVKNVEYINKLVTSGKKIPPDRTALLQKTKLSLPISQKRIEKLKNDLAELDERLSEIPTSYLSSNIIFPPTSIRIGAQKYKIDRVLKGSKIYCNKDREITIGKKS